MKLTPIREYVWTNDYSFHRTLTCRNHTTARYLTKNPWARSIHIIALPEGDIPRSVTGECQCPLSDLVVIEPSKDKRENDNSWIRNNALMLRKLRIERRDLSSRIHELRISIRATRIEMLRCDDNSPMREMLAGRIANLRRWISEYQDANVRSSRAIVILADSISR